MSLAFFCGREVRAAEPEFCRVLSSVPGGGERALAGVAGTLMLFHGRSVMVSPDASRRQNGCVAWLKGDLPDSVKEYLSSNREVVFGYRTVSFAVRFDGKLERRKGFRREKNPPYPGNGFGVYSTYEYQVTVRRWIAVSIPPVVSPPVPDQTGVGARQAQAK